MKNENSQLIVEGAPYAKSFHPPSCSEILKASKEQRIECLSKEITKGHSKVYQQQEFTGYTVVVKDVHEANIVYAKIKSIHPKARHVIGACRVPGREFHKCQDFYNDGEHQARAVLLGMLLDSEIQNRAVFVVSKYNGDHIGSKRFNLMQDAVKSAVDRAPVNHVTGNHNTIWNRDFQPRQHNGVAQSNFQGCSGVRGGRAGRGISRNKARATSLQ